MQDGLYFKKKLLLQHVVHGPEARLSIGENTDLNDTVFNTMSGDISIGDYTIFGHGCQVLTGTHPTGEFLAERKKHPHSGRDIRIGDGVCLKTKNPHNGGTNILNEHVVNQFVNRRLSGDRALDDLVDRLRDQLRFRRAAPAETTTAPNPRLLHHRRDVVVDPRLIDHHRLGNFFRDVIDNELGDDDLIDLRILDDHVDNQFVNH